MNITTNSPITFGNKHYSFYTPPKDSGRAPFHPDTVTVLDDIYANYKQSLNEIPFNEVRATALKVSCETQTPKKDVLKSMQLLTQFSNIKSLIGISETLKKENVILLGNYDSKLAFDCIDSGFLAKNVQNVCQETGIHRALTYVLNKKKLAPFDTHKEGKIGLILDEEKISQLEQVKRTQPKEFEKFVKNKNLKFIYISGWDTGIPVINRTKNLEEKTKELLERAKEHDLPLEKAVDYPNIDRIRDLGIRPVIIKNENEANELTIYNQMRPEQIRSKNTLYNIIEANTLSRSKKHNDADKAATNHVSAKYLENTLCVYTPEAMSKDLMLMNKKINDYAQKQNREVVYLIPNKDIKSTDYLNYSYRKINNIDSSKFVHIDELNVYNKFNPERNEDNTLYVILDDCALSGNSMNSIINYDFMGTDDKTPVLFANLKCSDEALNNFMNTSSHPAKVMYIDRIHSKYIGSDTLEDIIGEAAYQEEAYAVVFPYMAPDNNCELGSNIALLHNPKYNSGNFSSESQRNYYTDYELNQLDEDIREEVLKDQEEKRDYCFSSKTMSDNVLKVSAQYARTLGLSYSELPKSEMRYLTSKDLKEMTDYLLP